jgi:type II secretory pathway pseudopilin PulG
MRSTRGFTLMETIAALALVACTILVASGVALRHRSVARRFDEHAVALSVVSSRLAEAIASGDTTSRRLAYVPGPELPDGRGVLSVDPWSAGLARVRSELSWSHGRVVRETLVPVRR